jgi:hypothetical protein
MGLECDYTMRCEMNRASPMVSYMLQQAVHNFIPREHKLCPTMCRLGQSDADRY